MSSRTPAPGQLEEYMMNHKQRGSVLIFNHEQYADSLGLKERLGTAKDKIALTERFKELNFIVNSYDDLKKKEMMEMIHKAASDDHSDADCFVCVFLSHGKDGGHIYAFEDMVKIKEVTQLFRGDECRSLAGKPKIFIFQACRGEVSDDPVTAMAGDDDEEEVTEEPAMVYTLPAGADFLMCYAVAEGFQAYRNTESGSYYIQDLCETLQQQGSTLEFTELLTVVNMKVSRHCFKTSWSRHCFPVKKQMPCFTSMLTKKLYFRPKQ